MWPFDEKPETFSADDMDEAAKLAVSEFLEANSNELSDLLDPNRGFTRNTLSGGYDRADSLHNVYLDYGYPAQITFFNAWNMYRRLGIAKNVVEIKPDVGWAIPPTVKSEDKQFLKDFETLVKKKDFWQRMKSLDTRQRVGQYAGLFMRVKDGEPLNTELVTPLLGLNALEDMIPLFEGQLTVLTVEQDLKSVDYGQPTMFQFNSAGVGDRNRQTAASAQIHPSRIVTASEEADNGGIFGKSVLEAPFNSLMDVRKVIGGGAEGFYRNAAQSVIFEVTDKEIAKAGKTLVAKLSEQFDLFIRSRFRKGFVSTGLKPTVLDSQLIDPKEFFMVAIQDIAAAEKTPATILIGQQTGRLASDQDDKAFKAQIKSRQNNWQTEMTRDVIDWLIDAGILPSAEYEIEFEDIMALSDKEKLADAKEMTAINKESRDAGNGQIFTEEEIREAAGKDPEAELPGFSELDDDDEPVEDEPAEDAA